MTQPKRASLAFHGSLTPACIVVYLALHAIWQQMVFGPYAFVVLRLLFLIGIALVLILVGRGGEIRGYFVGQIVPELRAFRIIFLLLLLALMRLAFEAADPFPQTAPAFLWSDCVIAPINEEVVFRGVFLAILLQYLPQRPLAAIGISALVFASAHHLTKHGARLDPLFLLNLLAGGCAYGWIYWKTRSVTFCVLCHAYWNLFSFIPLIQHR